MSTTQKILCIVSVHRVAQRSVATDLYRILIRSFLFVVCYYVLVSSSPNKIFVFSLSCSCLWENKKIIWSVFFFLVFLLFVLLFCILSCADYYIYDFYLIFYISNNFTWILAKIGRFVLCCCCCWWCWLLLLRNWPGACDSHDRFLFHFRHKALLFVVSFYHSRNNSQNECFILLLCINLRWIFSTIHNTLLNRAMKYLFHLA